MSRVCAAGLAFLAFSCALIIGLCAGNPFVTVVGRALQIMGVFFVLGLIFGVIGEKAVKENFETQAEAVRQQMQSEEANSSNQVPASTDSQPSAPAAPVSPG
ncbi:MAG: hypothetical protein JW709_12285 [Sedimentisphaerales bacterium]|nr:hypothetical protein [Sedimentisphaerales bacterium]